MSDMNNLRASIMQRCKAICDLQLLNAQYIFYKNYEHQLRFMKIVSSVAQAEAISRADAFQYVLSQTEDIRRKKNHNKNKWQPYLDEVNKILTVHPFSSTEAEAIGMDIHEYFKQAGAIFWELCNQADDKEISASLSIYIVGYRDPYMIYDFKEEELLKGSSILPVEPSVKQPETAPKTEETPQNLAETVKVNPIELIDGRRFKVSTEPLTRTVKPETQSDNGTLDESDQPFVEVIDDKIGQAPEVVDEPLVAPERDARITSIIKGDDELERLYMLVRHDKTITGLFARELIIAKGKSS